MSTVLIGAVPDSFRVSVLNIAREQGTAEDWRVIDRAYISQKPVCDWIETILVDNNVANAYGMLVWFAEQYT